MSSAPLLSRHYSTPLLSELPSYPPLQRWLGKDCRQDGDWKQMEEGINTISGGFSSMQRTNNSNAIQNHKAIVTCRNNTIFTPWCTFLIITSWICHLPCIDMSSWDILDPPIVNVSIVTLTLTFLFYVVAYSPWLQAGGMVRWGKTRRSVFFQTNKQLLNVIFGILLQTLPQNPFYNE